jgi:hypothetical protein
LVSQEKIVVFRRVWRAGAEKYIIQIPKEIVHHYQLEGKFVKAVLEVIETEAQVANT